MISFLPLPLAMQDVQVIHDSFCPAVAFILFVIAGLMLLMMMVWKPSHRGVSVTLGFIGAALAFGFLGFYALLAAIGAGIAWSIRLLAIQPKVYRELER